MTETQTWTIKRLLEWTTDHFKQKGSESSRLDAEVLLAEALGCQRIELYTRFDQVPDEGALKVYRDWVKRHARGEPVAYLVGYKEFYSLRFNVNPSVLIPRPETEHLILRCLEILNLHNDRVGVIDVGTGSGCIAVTLAKQLENIQITATDISSEALSVACENAKLHNVQDRIEFLHGDLLGAVPADRQADLIVSNPPYIGRSEQGTVDVSVSEYEPELALFAGDTGTEVIRRLVDQSAERLSAGGFLVFETSPIVFDQCLEIVSAAHVFSDIQSIKDYSGHRRIISAKTGRASDHCSTLFEQWQ